MLAMANRKIIIVTISDLVEEANLHRKARTLVENGYRVEIFAAWCRRLDPDLWRGIKLVRRKIRFKPMVLRFVEFFLKALGYVFFRRADLFIAYDVYPLGALRIKSMFTSCRYIYDSVELFPDVQALQGKPLRRRFWKMYERFGIRGAQAAFTVCRSDARVVQHRYPFLPDVPFVRNVPVFRPIPRSDYLRKEYDVPEDSKIGIYQGKVFAGRGLRPLIRAVAEVPGITLFIVGDGPLKPELKKLAAELKAADRVIFIDAVPFDRLQRFTAGADIGFTLISGKGLSYYHALPNKLFEYIQAGLPVIGSNYPEIRAIIEQDGIGYAVDPEDHQAIKHALEEMLKEENYRTFRSKLEKVRQKYTWQKESAGYLQIIRSALDEN